MGPLKETGEGAQPPTARPPIDPRRRPLAEVSGPLRAVGVGRAPPGRQPRAVGEEGRGAWYWLYSLFLLLGLLRRWVSGGPWQRREVLWFH